MRGLTARCSLGRREAAALTGHLSAQKVHLVVRWGCMQRSAGWCASARSCQLHGWRVSLGLLPSVITRKVCHAAGCTLCAWLQARTVGIVLRASHAQCLRKPSHPLPLDSMQQRCMRSDLL